MRNVTIECGCREKEIKVNVQVIVNEKARFLKSSHECRDER